jgi:hypothetical protein
MVTSEWLIGANSGGLISQKHPSTREGHGLTVVQRRRFFDGQSTDAPVGIGHFLPYRSIRLDLRGCVFCLRDPLSGSK